MSGCATPDVAHPDTKPRRPFVDYNQNARDHTMAAAYSIRGVPSATVSTPDHVKRGRDGGAGRLHDGDRPPPLPGARRSARLHAGIDDAAFSIDQLIEWSARDERAVVVDAGGTDDGGRPRAAEGVEHTRDRLVFDPGAGSIDPRPARRSVPVRPGRRRFPA